MSDNGPAGLGKVPPTSTTPPPPPRKAPAGSTEDDHSDDDDLENENDEADETEDDSEVDDDDLDDDDEDDEDDEEDPVEARLKAHEERMQKRFDKAISKIQKAVSTPPARRKRQAPKDDDSEDDDDEEERRRPRSPEPRPADVSAIRVLARDHVADLMEKRTNEERAAVKAVMDRMIPVIDWSRVDDEGEFVEELVKQLSVQTSTLVKAGARRKVGQLRRKGMLAPGTAPQAGANGAGAHRPNGTTELTTALGSGRERAEKRWPGGKRTRIGG